MATNDYTVGVQGTDVYPGVANPTKSSVPADPGETNFVNDPTSAERGAGAGPDFKGDQDAKRALRGASQAGVVEAQPGIIEGANIDPLSETSNKDDGWANATVEPGQNNASAMGDMSGTLNSAKEVAAGAAKMAYGSMTGNNTYVEEGREAVFEKNR